MGTKSPGVVFAIFFVIVALLMVSSFKYQKPGLLFKPITGKAAALSGDYCPADRISQQWAVFVVISIYILSGIFEFCHPVHSGP